MKAITLISTLAITLLFTGCASIIHGPIQTVDFNSQPSGAKVTIDGKEYGVTPRSVDLRRMGRLKGEAKEKQAYNVKIELEGYLPYELKIKRDMDGWFIGNILFGGLIGIIVDASNGSMYKLSPDQTIATLSKSTTLTNKDSNVIYIATTLAPDPSWEKIGVLEKKN